MRNLVIILLLCAVGYAAWNYRQELSGHLPPLAAFHPSSLLPQQTPEPATPLPDGLAASAPEIAPPGVFYVKERFSVEGETGIKALRPGEIVRLMYRHKDGRMLVTNGKHEFTVKPTTLTQNRSEALRAAPR